MTRRAAITSKPADEVHMKHCNDCHKDGEPLTNSRKQERCRFCYSLRLESIPEPIVIEQDYPNADKHKKGKAK